MVWVESRKRQDEMWETGIDLGGKSVSD